jgi:hypothetical protein
MKLTDEQITAITAFGLLIMNEPDALLAVMSEDVLRSFSADVDKYLCTHVTDDTDMATPVINVLNAAIAQAVAEKLV